MGEQHIGFIGGGNMARALLGGLVQSGIPAGRLWVSDPDEGARTQLARDLGVHATADNQAVVEACDVVVLAVKPQVLGEVARGLDLSSRPQVLVISIAAGVRTEPLSRWLGGHERLVRAMPNTPALVGSGVAGLYARPGVDEAGRETAERVLRAVGTAVWVESEDLLDAVTAVSGSGPAYFFLVMEAMEAAAGELGLDAATARLLTVETAFGAAKLALEAHEPAAVLRQRVTSPGGTTAAALAVLEAGDLRGLFTRALAAARDRARELAAELEG